MKKNFLFGVLALAGLLSSCSHDGTADALQNSESDRVTLTATLPADFATIGTRAMTTPPDGNHKLRCILEVWTQGENPVLKHRYERADFSSTNEVNFSFTIDQGTYDCLFWADYVLSKGNDGTKVTVPNEYMHYTDKYYKTNDETNGLKAISLIAEGYAGGYNNNARDAFFGYYKLEKGVASVRQPDIPALTRPLAKLTIKEKNADNYNLCTGMTATYSVPTGFNVLTKAVNTENPLTVTCSEFMDNSSTLEIFTDYILTDASSTFGQIAMTFTGRSGITFQKIDIPAGIPLKRNHKTNATGTLLREEPKPTNDVLLTFVISDVWETDAVEKDLSAWDGTTKTQPAGYDATTPGMVDITTAAELAWLAKTCSAGTKFDGYTFNLTTDINLDNHEWTPIGRSGNPFKGKFNGQNHTVSNLNCTASQFGGLFGYIDEAEVKDVTVSGVVSYDATTTICRLGGIAGNANICTISGCTNQCDITATGENKEGHVGGIAGIVAATCTLSNNTNIGTLSTNSHTSSTVGGIAGKANAVGRYNIILSGNTYSGGKPNDVCIGMCNILNGGSVTVNSESATNEKPYPVPTE